LTSAISLLEVVVSAAIDGFGWSRRKASLAMGSAIALLGFPSAHRLDFLDAVDTLANNVFLIGGALGLAIFTGYVMREPVAVAREGSAAASWSFLWLPLLRYVVPVVLITILVVSVPGALEKLVALF